MLVTMLVAPMWSQAVLYGDLKSQSFFSSGHLLWSPRPWPVAKKHGVASGTGEFWDQLEVMTEVEIHIS